MASNYTENYQLCQWEATDQVKRTEFNADNAKVDEALKGHDDEIAALAAQDTVLESAIALCGNCEIAYFTYMGTSTNENLVPTQIAFPKDPLFYVVMGNRNTVPYTAFGSRSMSFVYLMLSDSHRATAATWTGNTLSFSATHPEWQVNEQGVTYHVVALYARDQA